MPTYICYRIFFAVSDGLSAAQSQCFQSFKASKSFVYSLALNPVSRAIVSGGYDGSIAMFHLSSRDPLMRFSAHSEPVVSIAVDLGGRHFSTGAQDGLVRLWSCAGPSVCVKTIIGTENQAFPM